MARRLTDAQLAAQLPAARQRGIDAADREARAIAASYDRKTARIQVELSNGCAFSFPAELGQGLRGASPKQLAAVEVTPKGEGLHWEELDADLLVDQLVRGVFGSKRWMSAIGRAGGSAKSKAKTAAARANGAKGGRPRKRSSETRREKSAK
jgi:hypothetical protein